MIIDLPPQNYNSSENGLLQMSATISAQREVDDSIKLCMDPDRPQGFWERLFGKKWSNPSINPAPAGENTGTVRPTPVPTTDPDDIGDAFDVIMDSKPVVVYPEMVEFILTNPADSLLSTNFLSSLKERLETADYSLSFENDFKKPDGQRFLITFLSWLGSSKDKNEVISATLELYKSIPSSFQDPEIIRLMEEVMRGHLLMGDEDFVADLFNWSKDLILDGKFPHLDKKVFLVPQVRQTINLANTTETSQFFKAMFSFTPEMLEKALWDMKSPQGKYHDPDTLFNLFMGNPKIDFSLKNYGYPEGFLPNFVTFQDLARQMEYTIHVGNGATESFRSANSPDSRENIAAIIQKIQKFVASNGLALLDVQRLADFFANFASQGIFACKTFSRGGDFIQVPTQGDSTQIEVFFENNGDVVVKGSTKSKNKSHCGGVIDGVGFYIVLNTDIEFEYKYHGLWSDNKGVPFSIKMISAKVEYINIKLPTSWNTKPQIGRVSEIRTHDPLHPMQVR